MKKDASQGQDEVHGCGHDDGQCVVSGIRYQGILFKLGRPIARGYYKGTQYKETIHT